MKSFIIFILVAIIILLIRICILDNRVRVLEYENAKLQFMIEDVVNYSDSTADTGEFDEFVVSPQGKRFFKTYNTIYNK